MTTINMIGDSYTFLITREAFLGASRFEDFVSGLRVSRTRLSERLKHLVALGVFEKKAYTESSTRYGYQFTEKGRSLYQTALTLLEWGDEWRPQHKGIVLQHRLCGNPLAQKTICINCVQEVHYGDIIWPSSPMLKELGSTSKTVKGWRKTGSLTHVSDRSDSATKTLEAVGDRWSILIMYLALHDPFQFKDAKNSLGVADNILSKRLKHLVRQNLLKREMKSGKQIYAATHSGLALLPAVLAQRMWARQWETHIENQWAELRHSICGNTLETTCICNSCEIAIFPGEVDIGESQ